MIGAILGDIIGSPYEFDMGERTTDFPLFSKYSTYTDDTVMTLAIAEALMSRDTDADADIDTLNSISTDADINESDGITENHEIRISDEIAALNLIREACIDSMKSWGVRYPDSGYGGRFYYWVLSDDREPYNSYGNGSAMRVSAAGWLYDTLEKTQEIAAATAAVTHNHPEGIKGAVATASVIFLARTGTAKDEIKRYVETEFGYDLTRSLAEIRRVNKHDETCMRTVPEAITAFLEADDLESTIRNAVSLGGDTDTLAAIAGSMGEAMYGVPDNLRAELDTRLEPEMLEVLEHFLTYIEHSNDNLL